MERRVRQAPAAKPMRLVMLVVIIVGAVLVVHYSGVDLKRFTPTKIKEFIQGFGALAPLVFIAIYAARAVVLVIPVGVISWVGGLAFGKLLGTVYILIGATLGSTLAFLVARYFGRGFIESFEWLHKGRIKQFDDKAAQEGFRLMLFIRLIPLFQYDAVNFGAGLSKIKLRDFMLASLIGMAPGGFINATLGSSLENIKSMQFFVALGAFVLLMLVPLIYKKIKKRREAAQSPLQR